jgi:hemerythrin
MLVDWKEIYATGIDEIDGHHKHLIKLLNRSYFLIIENGSQEKLKQLLDELIDYAGYHFSAEEELMRSHDYQDIDRHLREHFSFTNKMLSFQKDAGQENKYLSVEVFDFVRNWLLDHILTSDAEMARAVR